MSDKTIRARLVQLGHLKPGVIRPRSARADPKEIRVRRAESHLQVAEPTRRALQILEAACRC